MARPGSIATLASAALVITALLSGCSGSDSDATPNETITATPHSESPPTSDSPTEPGTTSSPSDDTAAGNRPAKVIGTIAKDLKTPWGIGFLPDGDAVVTERDTRRVLLLKAPSYDVRQVGVVSAAVPLGSEGGEAGLLGVAVSPDFASDHLLYFYLSTAADNRIVKATLEKGRLGTPTVILDGIPNGFIHDGGRLAFGPDGYLYVSTGETGEGPLAQERDGLAGKILRITPDGRPAPGNPFDTPVWSWGHRNVQGLAFDGAGVLWASEFGQDEFDELNRIDAGANYGWPEVEGEGGADQGFAEPQQVWNPDDSSPSGLAYLDGYLWMAALKGERLWRVRVDGRRAVEPEGFFIGEYGRVRTVAVAPDGGLWVMTSNRDTRGTPREGDDKILLVQP
jgi:glucose/arabinose dehydrogenase